MFGMLAGNISEVHNLGDLVQVMLRSETMLVHFPKAQGGGISRNGGVGDWPRHWGCSLPDMYEMALFKEGHLLWEASLEV